MPVRDQSIVITMTLTWGKTLVNQNSRDTNFNTNTNNAGVSFKRTTFSHKLLNQLEYISYPCGRYGFCPGQEGEIRTYYDDMGHPIQVSDEPGLLTISMENENSEQIICVEVPVTVDDDE